MKKVIILIVFGVVFAGTCLTVYAHEGGFELNDLYTSLAVDEPSLLPGNALYFVKNIQRGVKLLFTFAGAKKTELELRFADEKFAEMAKLAVTYPEKETARNRALQNYLAAQDRLKIRLAGLQGENKNIGSLLEKLAERVLQHQQTFQKFEDEFGKDDKEKVNHALAESLKQGVNLNREKIKGALEKKINNPDEYKPFEELKEKDPELKKLDEELRTSIQDFEKNTKKTVKKDCGPQPLGLPINCSDVVCKDGKWEFICEANSPIFRDVQKCGQYPTEPDYWICQDGKWQRDNSKAKENDIKCFIGGCNGELCLSEDQRGLASICLYKEEYACYKTALCKTQSDGKCGWTKPDGLTACIENARKKESVAPPLSPPPPPPSPPPSNSNSILQNFRIEADDYGFYPSNSLVVPKGTRVQIVFVVRKTNVYYGGLDFRFPTFKTPTYKPGDESQAVEFMADEPFVITSYWPASGIRKADLKIEVK